MLSITRCFSMAIFLRLSVLSMGHAVAWDSTSAELRSALKADEIFQTLSSARTPQEGVDQIMRSFSSGVTFRCADRRGISEGKGRYDLEQHFVGKFKSLEKLVATREGPLHFLNDTSDVTLAFLQRVVVVPQRGEAIVPQCPVALRVLRIMRFEVPFDGQPRVQDFQSYGFTSLADMVAQSNCTTDFATQDASTRPLEARMGEYLTAAFSQPITLHGKVGEYYEADATTRTNYSPVPLMSMQQHREFFAAFATNDANSYLSSKPDFFTSGPEGQFVIFRAFLSVYRDGQLSTRSILGLADFHPTTKRIRSLTSFDTPQTQQLANGCPAKICEVTCEA